MQLKILYSVITIQALKFIEALMYLDSSLVLKHFIKTFISVLSAHIKEELLQGLVPMDSESAALVSHQICNIEISKHDQNE